jgi:hypothetical protein
VVNVNIAEVVETVLSAAGDIVRLRPQLEKIELFDLSTVDTLEDAALALLVAHNRYKRRCSERVKLAPLGQEQRKVRRQLIAATAPFVALGLLDGSRIKKFTGASYRRLAFDVVTLVDIFLGRWDDFVDKTPLSRQQLETLRANAERFLKALGSRQANGATAAAAALAQRQAFTLLVRNYTEIRTTLQFLRREQGDAETIAPSLFRCRGRRPGKGKANAARAKKRGSKNPGSVSDGSRG